MEKWVDRPQEFGDFKKAAGKIATRMNNAKFCRWPTNCNNNYAKVCRLHKINDDDNDAKIVS